MGLLKVCHLKKRFGGSYVVQDFSLLAPLGEVIGLLGPNGAGKTTAFYMIMGLIPPDEGQVFFQEQDITFLPIHKRAQLGMGYLAQEPSIFRHLTVEENILCILETLPLSKKERNLRLGELLEELGLQPLAKKLALELSGGERRRLEITRALVTNPTLLLLDEPFANIDPLAIYDLKQMIKLLAAKKITILITDHNAREIFSVASYCYLMREGRVFLSGKAEELIAHPDARTFYLGEEFHI